MLNSRLEIATRLTAGLLANPNPQVMSLSLKEIIEYAYIITNALLSENEETDNETI